MNIEKLNIIYTFVPPKNGWIYNRDFYIVDLESLCLSAITFKSKFKYKKMKLYTTKFFYDFFIKTEIFDVIIDIEKESNDLKKIDTSMLRTNTLYKLFVPSMEVEPFIHIDHDMFINDVSIFEKINTDIFFSFPETIYVDNNLHSFYGFYIDVLNDVKRIVNNEKINNLNQNIAYNCSIFGSTNESLINSFTHTKEFFIKNFKNIVHIERIDCFLEQLLQISYLNSIDISTFDEIIEKNGKIVDFDIDGHIVAENMLVLKEEYKKRKMIHISGDRYSTYYRQLIPDLLLNHNKSIRLLIKNI